MVIKPPRTEQTICGRHLSRAMSKMDEEKVNTLKFVRARVGIAGLILSPSKDFPRDSHCQETPVSSWLLRNGNSGSS